VKTLTSQKRRALLTARKLLQEKAIAMENDMRGLLRNFGLNFGTIRAFKFDERIRELIEASPDLAEIIEPLLMARNSSLMTFQLTAYALVPNGGLKHAGLAATARAHTYRRLGISDPADLERHTARSESEGADVATQVRGSHYDLIFRPPLTRLAARSVAAPNASPSRTSVVQCASTATLVAANAPPTARNTLAFLG
jgi:hypothetical protein